MTTTPGWEAIDLVLRQLHVFSMQPEQRKEIARGLHVYGITVPMVRAVWTEARQSSRDDDSARGLFASTLRDPGTVREVADDVEERLELLRGLRGVESGMAFVSATNPYGWNPARVEQLRRDDHSEPGTWNAFRQGYNMRLEEARELGLTDVRRHGCSRVEYLGLFVKARYPADGLHATAEWISPAATSPVPAAPQPQPTRDIYGTTP